jgi:hypothetical protein
MTGGTAAHAVIQHDLYIVGRGRLRGGPRRFCGSDLKTETAIGFRYPDGFVVCSLGRVLRRDRDFNVLTPSVAAASAPQC